MESNQVPVNQLTREESRNAFFAVLDLACQQRGFYYRIQYEAPNYEYHKIVLTETHRLDMVAIMPVVTLTDLKVKWRATPNLFLLYPTHFHFDLQEQLIKLLKQIGITKPYSNFIIIALDSDKTRAFIQSPDYMNRTSMELTAERYHQIFNGSESDLYFAIGEKIESSVRTKRKRSRDTQLQQKTPASKPQNTFDMITFDAECLAAESFTAMIPKVREMLKYLPVNWKDTVPMRVARTPKTIALHLWEMARVEHSGLSILEYSKNSAHPVDTLEGMQKTKEFFRKKLNGN